MAKRFLLVFLLVFSCCLGCGGGSKPTLKNLTYKELSELREIQLKHLNAAEDESDEYFEALQKLIVINTLRDHAWESENKESGVKEIPSVAQLRQERADNISKAKAQLGISP